MQLPPLGSMRQLKAQPHPVKLVEEQYRRILSAYRRMRTLPQYPVSVQISLSVNPLARPSTPFSLQGYWHAAGGSSSCPMESPV